MKTKYAKVRTEVISLDKLDAAVYNARTITNEAISGLAASLERLGLVAFPVVNKRKGKFTIIGGHQRVEVLRRQGIVEVLCVVVEFDDALERQANLALNNRAIQGEFIPEMTRAMIEELNKALGVDAQLVLSDLRLDALAKQVTRAMRPTDGVDNVEAEGNVDDDDEPSIPKSVSVSRVGAYYQLNDHLLYCGKPDSNASLAGFGVEHADAGFTFCPSDKALTDQFVDSWLNTLIVHTEGPVYVACSMTNLAVIQRRFVALNGHWSNTLIWYSSDSKPDKADPYRGIALPVLYGWREGSSHYFCGQRDQGNVFKMKRAPKSVLPVEVVTKLLMNSTKSGSRIFDTNVGRGASLIAAEKTKRKLFGYVWNAREMDAVRKRWVEFTMPKGTNWQSATPEKK